MFSAARSAITDRGRKCSFDSDFGPEALGLPKLGFGPTKIPLEVHLANNRLKSQCSKDSHYSLLMGISGVSILKTNSLKDSRGDFVKIFAEERELHLPQFVIAESFYSRTLAGAARGMHLQVGHGASNRIICCVQGRILDVLLDLRKESVSYLEIETLYMGPEEVNSIYVPAGVAHGFLALENSITFYISDKAHSLDLDKGVHIESLGIEFPIKSILLSDRDKELPNLDLWVKNYT